MKDAVPDEVLQESTDGVVTLTSAIDNEVRIMRNRIHQLELTKQRLEAKTKENVQKLAVNTQLPHLVGNLVEFIDPEAETEEEDMKRDGSTPMEVEDYRGKGAVVKTSTRQTVFLPIPGLVPVQRMKPNDLVAMNKDTYLILDTLPPEYDSRVKAMEVDERPTEDYADVGGLDKQIQELIEAVVLPMTHKERFDAIGIRPPRGVLLYGPPGTGKTLLARACAAQTHATFLKLAGPQLVQMFIGDGAKLVRDLAREKAPAIVFVDELDAIGTKRFDSDKSGDREVQRTMLELLNQMCALRLSLCRHHISVGH